MLEWGIPGGVLVETLLDEGPRRMPTDARSSASGGAHDDGLVYGENLAAPAARAAGFRAVGDEARYRAIRDRYPGRWPQRLASRGISAWGRGMP